MVMVGAEADIFRHTFSSNQLMRQLRMKMGNYRKTPEAISSLSPEQYRGNPGERHGGPRNRRISG